MGRESVLLGIEDEVLMGEGAAATIAQLLPFPAEDANKYTRGRLAVVAGCGCYPGAAALAARAAQIMGAGYTQVMCAPEVVGAVRAAAPSLVVQDWDGWDPAVLPIDAPGKPVAVCLGPGFDPSDADAIDLAAEVLVHAACPVVVDGGALALLSQPRAQRILNKRTAGGFSTVITPHGGEAERLAAAWDIAGDAHAGDDAADLALDLAEALDCTVLLKGPVSHIACNKDALSMDFGGPELAKAGTGDVLAGMVGALLAQNMHPYDAAVLAATVHALAGACAAEDLTSICVTAEDVIDYIPRAVKALRLEAEARA